MQALSSSLPNTCCGLADPPPEAPADTPFHITLATADLGTRYYGVLAAAPAGNTRPMQIYKDEGHTDLCLPVLEADDSANLTRGADIQSTISWSMADSKVFAEINATNKSDVNNKDPGAVADKVKVWLTAVPAANNAAACSLRVTREEAKAADFVLLEAGGPAALVGLGMHDGPTDASHATAATHTSTALTPSSMQLLVSAEPVQACI